MSDGVAPRRPPLSLIYAVTVAGILANTLVSPNIPDILADLGQPESRAGLLVGIGPLPGVVIAPVIGVLADRWGRRKVLLPCLVSFGVFGLMAALAPTFEVMLLARFLQGFGSAGLINLAVVLIGDHWEGMERTKLVGRNAAVLTICLATIPALSGVIAEYSSWRWAMGLAVLALPVAAAAAKVLPAHRPVVQHTIGEQVRGALEAVRHPIVLTVVGAGFLLFVVIFGVFLTALPVHLEKEFGLGAGARGLVLSVPAIGSTIAAFNLSRVRARLPIRWVLVAASGLIAVAAFGLAVAPVVGLVLVVSVVYGLGDGTAIPSLQDVATSASPVSQRASVMAAWVSAVRLGQAIGPVAAAAMFGATSTRATMLVGAGVFAVVGLVFAAGPIDEETLAGAARPA